MVTGGHGDRVTGGLEDRRTGPQGDIENIIKSLLILIIKCSLSYVNGQLNKVELNTFLSLYRIFN